MLISSYVEEALKYDMADILVCVGDVPHESLSGLARKFGTYKNTVRIALEKLYAEEFGALPVDAKAEATR
ncbi:MAG: hypothetical protein FWD61_18970 [Phycisphaerales bacterium]|nr:hypothetical protein [Phycisphaerales bacterium]